MPLFRFSMIRRGLLLFWALWLSVVALTNVADALAATGTLYAGFPFRSGNWAWIGQVMHPVGVPVWLQAAMFGGAIAWEAAGAIAFWIAFAKFQDRPFTGESAAVAACIINLALWAAFNILDEVFLAYGPEGVHRVVLLTMIATVLALQLLPGSDRPFDEHR